MAGGPRSAPIHRIPGNVRKRYEQPTSKPNRRFGRSPCRNRARAVVALVKCGSGGCPGRDPGEMAALLGGYNELTDELKEADRVWARKVVALLRQRKLIQ